MNNRLKVIRAERNLSQSELAKMVGISRTALIAIEKGKSNPDGTTIVKLVKALNLRAEDIFLDLFVV